MSARSVLDPRWLRSALVLAALCALAALVVPASSWASDANRASCPNEATTGFRPYLPDCRAYEMVSPLYKEGFIVGMEAISESGEQLLARSFGSFSEPRNTSGLGTTYNLKRTAGGWSAAPMTASTARFVQAGLVASTPDFTNGLWEAVEPGQIGGSLYTARSTEGPFELVGPDGAPTAEGTPTLGAAGGSRDLSHTLYTTNTPSPGVRSRLWPGDATKGLGQSSLYEYAGTGNTEPTLVGVSDEHAVAHIAEAHLISECGTDLGAVDGNKQDAISEDGQVVFFTAVGRDSGECFRLAPTAVQPEVSELYARIDGTHTVAISQPIPTDCGKCELSNEQADAEYQGASTDGSRVYFTSAQRLLPEASGVGPYLYEYDFAGPPEHRVTLISQGDPAGARVQGVQSVSTDGTHVYFMAEGVLTSTPNAEGRQPEPGAPNLYVYERDAADPAGRLAFIATATVGKSQTTPDGRFLIFESSADLTPDQEGQPEAGQVFLYDSQTGSLARVSHGQDGYNDNGNSASLPASIPAQTKTKGFPVGNFAKLALSADGAYAYFTSEDALTPQAVDGAMNVYEYHEGQVFLITDGLDRTRVFGTPAVELLGTSESGHDVYFTTADGLLPQDTDTQIDLYDARIDGGFPPPAEPSACVGDACHGPLAAELAAPTPATNATPGETLLPAPPAAVVGKPAVKPKPKPKLKRKRKSKKRRHRKPAHRAASKSSGRAR